MVLNSYETVCKGTFNACSGERTIIEQCLGRLYVGSVPLLLTYNQMADFHKNAIALLKLVLDHKIVLEHTGHFRAYYLIENWLEFVHCAEEQDELYLFPPPIMATGKALDLSSVTDRSLNYDRKLGYIDSERMLEAMKIVNGVPHVSHVDENSRFIACIELKCKLAPIFASIVLPHTTTGAYTRRYGLKSQSLITRWCPLLLRLFGHLHCNDLNILHHLQVSILLVPAHPQGSCWKRVQLPHACSPPQPYG